MSLTLQTATLPPSTTLYESSWTDFDTTTATTTPKEISSMSPTLQFIGKTTSTVVSATFFIVLAWQRDALMVSFFMGAISNGLLSKILKKLIRQARPMLEEQDDIRNGNGGGNSSNNSKFTFLEPPPPSDNGMPSSHAMSLGFIGTFTGLLLLEQPYHPYSSAFIAIYASISLRYRIRSKLHTWEQIAVGLAVGTTNAIVWRCLCFGTTQPFNALTPNDLPFSVMELVTNHLLNDRGVLPLYGLAVPAAMGAVIVGSVERRIRRFLKLRNEKEEREKEKEQTSKQA